MTFNDTPIHGALGLLRGFRLLAAPGLRRYVLMPLLINTLVFAVLIWLGIGQFEALLDWLLPSSEWLQWLRWLLWPLFVIALLLIAFTTFALVANLIAAPFNGLLAEKVEELLTGQTPSAPGGGVIADLLPSLRSELAKLVYFLLRALPLLVLFLIPGLNLIAPLLWFVFNAWFLALEYADYPMANSGLKFNQQLALRKQTRWTSLGFGASTQVALMVPLLNLAVMPAAVAGATVLWVEQHRLD